MLRLATFFKPIKVNRVWISTSNYTKKKVPRLKIQSKRRGFECTWRMAMTDSNSPRRNFLCVRSILWTISWYNPHHFFFRPYIMSVKRPLHNGINFSPETFSIKVFFYWRLNLQVFDPFQIPSGWLISISKRSKKVPKMLMIKKEKRKEIDYP